MEKWCEIRQRVLRDGVSIRQIQRETGFHFETIKKILAHPSPPEFQTPIRPKTKIGPYLERIAGILQLDQELPRKLKSSLPKASSLWVSMLIAETPILKMIMSIWLSG